jgi:hypothetical protein
MSTRASVGGALVATMVAAIWGACSLENAADGGGAASSSQGGHTGGGDTGAGGGIGGMNFGGNASGGMTGCDPQTFMLQKAPAAQVYLVIDRSGSMSEAGTNPALTKWEELNTAVDTALTQYEGVIQFGLLMYPSGQECATSGPQEKFDLDNRAAILAALSAAVPAGGTPTAAALNNAAASLTSLGSPDSPKFVVLATDGGPNCNYGLGTNPCACTYVSSQENCCTNYPQACVWGSSCLDDQPTLDVITDLHANQAIDTFVIGLPGTAEYESLLNAMADAGGRPQQGGPPNYYAASNPADLVAALQAIAVSVISCQIQLQQAPEYPDGVKVYIDGVEVLRDGAHQNGWDYTDDTFTTIELYGTSCVA